MEGESVEGGENGRWVKGGSVGNSGDLMNNFFFLDSEKRALKQFDSQLGVFRHSSSQTQFHLSLSSSVRKHLFGQHSSGMYRDQTCLAMGARVCVYQQNVVAWNSVYLSLLSLRISQLSHTCDYM